MPEVITPIEALSQVTSASSARDAAIAQATEMRRIAKEQFDQTQREARDLHHDANRSFVATVRRVHQESGLNLASLIGATGRTVQAFRRLESRERELNEV